jgi:predicted amidohydrolase YtcJ
MRTSFIALFLLFVFSTGAQHYQQADILIYNAKIYTLDAKFSTTQAIAIKNGLIAATGTTKTLLKNFRAKTMLNAEGKTILPGLIDAHAHFRGYALGLLDAQLVGTKSWDEIIKKLVQFRKDKKIADGEWLTGRGWDQNDWDVKEFPSKEKLDSLFPGNPVYLKRVDGHAAIVNQKALDIAGIHTGDTVAGGQIELINGRLTGILVDNAKELVASHIPVASDSQLKKALMEAQQNCFAVGLTTVEDCGLDYGDMMYLHQLQSSGDLKMRLFVMLSDNEKNFNQAFKNGKIKTGRMNVSSFKVYADGALGSRGACLLQPYEDKPGWTGFLLSSRRHFDSVAAVIYKAGWQMCTHAIGDSGNRTILSIYGKYLVGKNDRRWRIEHAQVVDQNDFPLFGKFNIIPSVQPTHATSDMYWAAKRLGNTRIKEAYAYKQLLLQNNWIPLGTDFPVEDISPFKTFYAAVFRKDATGWPAKGFQMENALSRKEALKGMTIWAAKSNFEEKEKGSLEKGKLADLIIIDRDIMTAKPAEVLKTKVLATYINGEKVYGK